MSLPKTTWETRFEKYADRTNGNYGYISAEKLRELLMEAASLTGTALLARSESLRIPNAEQTALLAKQAKACFESLDELLKFVKHWRPDPIVKEPVIQAVVADRLTAYECYKAVRKQWTDRAAREAGL